MTTRLSVPEATALHLQTATTPAHTLAVIVLEASDRLSHDRLGQWVAAGLSRSARFRSRLVGKPFDVGQPVWAEIDDFDPSAQIHRATAGAPAGEPELAEFVVELTSGKQDWRRNLWEAWTIDGLPAGRWAVAIKTSPVLNGEECGAATVHECLLTTGPDADVGVPTEAGSGPAPLLRDLVTDTLSEMVENQLIGMWMVTDAVTGVLLRLHRRPDDAAEPTVAPSAMPSVRAVVPGTVFGAPLTKRRAMAFVSVPMADAEVVSDAFGGNTANVLLAACTVSLRSWLARHGADSDETLLMEVPLSLPAGEPVQAGGTVAMGTVRLPVHLDDPVQVLINLHTATERLRIARSALYEEPYDTVDLTAMVSLLPPWAMRWGAQAYQRLGMSRLRAPSCHGSVSFVAGPAVPAYCAGAEVVGVYTAAPMVEGRGLSITATSRGAVMDLCLSACPDNVPDVGDIARGITDALQVLVSAAELSPRGEGQSVVTEMTSHLPQRSRWL